MTVKIEAGKFYRTRDGRKVGPMARNYSGFYEDSHPWRDPNSRHTFKSDGTYGIGQHSTSGDDLVAEWPDEPTAQRDTPKILGDMTDAEIGALVRAERQGSVIQVCDPEDPEFPLDWCDTPRSFHWNLQLAYRVKPKRITVDLMADFKVIGTIDMADGVPDFYSIRPLDSIPALDEG